MSEDKSAEVSVLKSDQAKPPTDQVGAKNDVCPWCNYSNKDDEKGPLHEKVKNVVRNRGHKYQCDTCGKFWEPAQFNKPWSIELERGAGWVREMQARSLTER